MKLAVVGSINMDMTVTAERIPLKGRHCLGTAFTIFRAGRCEPGGRDGETWSRSRDVRMCGG